MLSRRSGTVRRDRAGHSHLEVAAARREMKPRFVQCEPIALLGDDLTSEQSDDDIEGFVHPRTQEIGRDPDHRGVRGELSGAAAEHEPSMSEVVEQRGAVRNHERVVVREGDHSSA